MRLDDPAVVHAEYADEQRLATRKAAHAHSEGPDAREVLFGAIREAAPRRLLEVGCGEGELAARVAGELCAEVIAVDQSERMVELARRRGVDARVGDVQELDLPAHSFDCVVAAWVLFHVRDIERALAEIDRVLAPRGRLVAVTNDENHLRELYRLIGGRRWETAFWTDEAERMLRARFPVVHRRDAHGWLVFPDAAAAQRYVDSGVLTQGSRVPDVAGPIRARRTPTIFVAEKA